LVDAPQEQSMTEAIRLGVIVPSVNIVVEEWYPRVVPDAFCPHADYRWQLAGEDHRDGP
jgi:hypothetical protein